MFSKEGLYSTLKGVRALSSSKRCLRSSVGSSLYSKGSTASFTILP